MFALARRAAKAIYKFAKDNNIPVVQFGKKQNKEKVALPPIEAAAREGKDRVVMIGIAQEKASAWRSWKATKTICRPHSMCGCAALS